jgi:hypothetical protein
MKINETKRTLIYLGVAVLSVGAATATHYVTRPKPDVEYQGVGGEFYPEFQDPTAAQVLRVVAYDPDTAAAKIFKVEYRDGKWRIPSHHDYPADGKDRLARTAASVIGMTKTALVSRLKSDQARYDVTDPEDTDATVLSGRGQKITIAKNDGTVLAEYVIGKQAEGQTDLYYVRGTKTEDNNAIYLAKLKLDLSTKFSDWIEPDLLKVDRDKLTDIRSDSYSIDDTQGVLVPGEVTELKRKTSSDPWKLVGMNDKTEELKTDVVNQIVTNLDSLRLVGVRPKPQGVNPDLSIDKRIADSRELVFALRSDMANRGFYIASDRRGGATRLVSKEGEFEAGTNEGLRYALHFGQIFTGTEFDIETGLSKDAKAKDAKKDGDKKSAAGDSKTADKKEPDKKEPVKKGRYLMIYTAFDPKLVGEPPVKPSEPKKPDGLVLDTPASKSNGDAATTATKPDAKSTSAGAAKPNAVSKPVPAGNGKIGNKQSAVDKQDDANLMALAFADPKADATPPATTPSKPAAPGKPAAAATKTSPPAKTPAQTAADKAKPAAPAKPAPPQKTPPKPDPKTEYEKALSQYKKDVERYENDKSEYEKKLKKGQEKAKELNDRFGPWYYVISAESFENLRLTHAGLVKPKGQPGAKKDAAGPADGESGLPHGFPGALPDLQPK